MVALMVTTVWTQSARAVADLIDCGATDSLERQDDHAATEVTRAKKPPSTRPALLSHVLAAMHTPLRVPLGELSNLYTEALKTHPPPSPSERVLLLQQHAQVGFFVQSPAV